MLRVTHMRRADWVILIGWIVLAQAAGLIGSFSTFANIPAWYAFLAKPDLAPPNWVFGPVWTTLYILMGIAAFLVWREGVNKRRVRQALVIFCFQLALNALWSVLFFGMRSLLLGLLGVAALWLSIALTMRLFARVSPAATWLLVPYLAWVSFASYLNYALWSLN